MTALFLVAAAFAAYTYVGFPALLWARLRLRGLRAARVERLARAGHGGGSGHDGEGPGTAPTWEPGHEPFVSIVVAAHDEAERLPIKIASLDALDWPRDRLEAVFVSDGSSDGTVALLTEAARSRPWLRAIHYARPGGKPTALNVGVELARGEVLVFMDARQRVGARAVRELVDALGAPGVGAASGELLLDAGGAPDAASVGLYWRYEKWIRTRESELYSTTGATGALYAIRREHWTPHRRDVLLDDFDTPVALLRRGLRTVFVPGAKVFDLAEAEASGEFRRKVRTLAGNFQSFARAPWLFDPRRNPVWWQFVSHKVFRLLVPWALLAALAASALGTTAFLDAMLALQVALYGLGLASALGLETRLGNVVRVFVQLNAAAVLGAWRWASGGTGALWRRPAVPARRVPGRVA